MAYTVGHPVVRGHRITDEKIRSQDIKRVIKQRIIAQRQGTTWWNEEVELKNGRRVTIRTLTTNRKEA